MTIPAGRFDVPTVTVGNGSVTCCPVAPVRNLVSYRWGTIVAGAQLAIINAITQPAISFHLKLGYVLIQS